jgi:hypothetical protein
MCEIFRAYIKITRPRNFNVCGDIAGAAGLLFFAGSGDSLKVKSILKI